jgi:hypothetical protein
VTEEQLPPLELPTLLVQPKDGLLAGRTIRMRWPSTRFYIDHARGSRQDRNAALWEETLNAIQAHDFGHEPDNLPPEYIVALADAWIDAVRDHAVPPTNGSD